MKNNLYPQTNQAFDRSFDDYDSVIGNEFSVNSSAKSGGASHHSDDMSSLGNSQLGPNSAANSPVRMSMASAAAASANPQQWRQQQQRAPMTPMSSGSSDSDGLRVGDVSLILGDSGRVNNSAADIESMGGDSLFMMSPPVCQSANLEKDAAAWDPAPTHKYDTGTSKYLQLGPLGDELSFSGQDPTNNNHPTFTNEGERDIDSEDDYDDDVRSVYFLPQGRFGHCVVIGSTILVVGALIISVVAILNLNAVINNQNDSSKLNIEAVGGANPDVILTTLTPTEPPSTLAPIVPPTTNSPTLEPIYVTDSPTAAPLQSTGSPIVQSVSIETQSPETSFSTLAPSKEPTTDESTLSPVSTEPTEVPTSEEPTNSPSAATLSPTSSEPSKEPTTDEPTPSPSKALENLEPSLNETEAPVITTSSPSKAPITEEPTISFEPTLSPTKQSLLTAGRDASEERDTHFYLVSDSLYVRQDWKKNFGKLGNGRAKFMIHVGSATPVSEDCPEEAFMRTEKSLSFSPVVAFSLPGNNDYTNCPDPSLAWGNYTEYLMNINKKYWPDNKGRYQVKRDPVRPENFAFIYRRVLFAGLNMVSNEDENKTATRLEENLQWLDDNVEHHEDIIDVIFMTGNGRLRDLATFRDAIVEKKYNEWKNKLVIYARRAQQTKLFANVEGTKNFHELTVGVGYPITDVHIDITSGNKPRVGYRYSDGSPTPDV